MTPEQTLRQRVRRLAKLHPKTPEAREAALQNVDELTLAAVSYCKRFATKRGETVEIPAPDIGAAVKCQELGAKLLGLFDLEAMKAKEVEEVELSIPVLEMYLERAGYRLVPIAPGEHHDAKH